MMSDERETQLPIKAHKSIQARFLLGFTTLFTLAFIIFGLATVSGLPFPSLDGWTGNARQEAAHIDPFTRAV